jgi:hypothetical protein
VRLENGNRGKTALSEDSLLLEVWNLLRLANATRPQADGSALESPTAITLEDGKRARLDFNIAF